MRYNLLGFIFITAGFVYGQDITLDAYHPRIAELGVESLIHYKTRATSESFGSAQNEVARDHLIKAKIGIPVIMKDQLIIGGQLKYYEQNFWLDTDAPINYDLFEHINSKRFTSAGIRGFIRKEFHNTSKITLIAGGELKSDQIEWNKNTTKYFLSADFRWVLNPSSVMGAGLVTNWTMGVMTFYPLLIYEKQLSKNWTLDLSLPKSAAIRRKIGHHNYLIGKTEFKAWRYNLTNAIDQGNKNYTLSRADLQFYISWEHELNNWLWAAIDLGYNKNLRYFVVNPGDRFDKAVININTKDAPYFKLSIFAVPPKQFYK